MSGSRALYLIPVSALDHQQLAAPGHGASQTDMARWMSHVPRINQMREAGYTTADFDRLRASRNPAQRELGETEYRLYRDDASAIKAGYDGRRLDLEGGRHRVEAARSAGVDRIPVRVWASEAHHRTLEELYGNAERQRERPDRLR